MKGENKWGDARWLASMGEDALGDEETGATHPDPPEHSKGEHPQHGLAGILIVPRDERGDQLHDGREPTRDHNKDERVRASVVLCVRSRYRTHAVSRFLA